MKSIQDLTGRTFGRLTVVRRAGHNKEGRPLWLCECSCKETDKNTKVVLARLLLNDKTQSCGCIKTEQRKARLKDRTGKTYGRLTVLERATNNEFGQSMWKCVCNCKETDQNVVVVSGYHLENGNTRSCGCLQREVSSVGNDQRKKANT